MSNPIVDMGRSTFSATVSNQTASVLSSAFSTQDYAVFSSSMPVENLNNLPHATNIIALGNHVSNQLPLNEHLPFLESLVSDARLGINNNLIKNQLTISQADATASKVVLPHLNDLSIALSNMSNRTQKSINPEHSLGDANPAYNGYNFANETPNSNNILNTNYLSSNSLMYQNSSSLIGGMVSMLQQMDPETRACYIGLFVMVILNNRLDSYSMQLDNIGNDTNNILELQNIMNAISTFMDSNASANVSLFACLNAFENPSAQNNLTDADKAFLKAMPSSFFNDLDQIFNQLSSKFAPFGGGLSLPQIASGDTSQLNIAQIESSGTITLNQWLSSPQQCIMFEFTQAANRLGVLPNNDGQVLPVMSSDTWASADVTGQSGFYMPSGSNNALEFTFNARTVGAYVGSSMSPIGVTQNLQSLMQNIASIKASLSANLQLYTSEWHIAQQVIENMIQVVGKAVNPMD